MNDSFEHLRDSVPRPVTKTARAEFWRKDPPILRPDGSFIGGMWPSHRKFWDLHNFIKVLVGGLGSGKSNIGCKRIISLAAHNAPCPVAVVCPTFAMARKTIIPTIRSMLAGKQNIYGPNEFFWKYNITTHEFRFRFHGRDAHIIIFSGEDPNSIRGVTLAAALMDECFIQEHAVMQQLLSRIRHPDAKLLELLLTGTPEQLNWGYDLCVGDDKNQRDVGLVQMSTRENLALSPEYVKRLEATYTDKVCQAYIDGKFVDFSSGLVFYSFDPSENIVDFHMQDSVELGAGMDFNVNPMTAAAFWTAGSHMHYFDEIELENADTEYMCQHLRERYGPRLQNIYPDPTGNQRHTNAPGGKTDFHYIEAQGFTVNAERAHPPLRDLENAVNGKLKPRDGKVSLTISPKCKKLRKYLSTYTHERRNKPDHKRMYHLLASFSYPVHYLFPVYRDQILVKRLIGA